MLILSAYSEDDAYGYYHEDGTKENFRFSVYVDNIVIKKISGAE